MKSAPFEYLAAESTREAIDVLSADDGAKVIAGGQSLVPLLALRLARPTVLVDINTVGLNDLHLDISADPAESILGIGALVCHRRVEFDPTVARHAPVLAEAAKLIGHPAIRNRGTIGGSLAHADPAAEMPAALLALGGSVVVEGPAGRREIRAADLFHGFMTTALAADELIVQILCPVDTSRRAAGAFCEWAARVGDFAEVGVALALSVEPDGQIETVGAAACGMASVPLSLTEAFTSADLLSVRTVTDRHLRAVAAAVSAACSGAGDDRAALAGLLAARATVRALRPTTGPVDTRR